VSGPLLNPAALVDLIASDPVALARLRALVDTGPAERPGPYMTADEAADYLRCSRKRVYDLAGAGRLRRHGDGRRLLLKRAEVEALAHGSGP
jgi:excisionase family DNA binding protein